ncbi:Crp/Fnr family transcriptional regulator [Polaromonas sp.]|nr:Crp/Fnr family transcriptional regulator [Candidatus Saccharibacteria bacterium]
MNTAVDAKIKQNFSKYPSRSYEKGQILVFADESPDHIFYLIKGKVRKYDVSYRGDEVIVNIFQPPSFFPMSWAINRTKNRYFYKTEEATELHVVPVDDALQFIQSNPDIMLDLLSRIYTGMDGLLGRVVHLMSGSAKSRLIYELVIECRRSGQKHKNGTYTLGTNEGDIAARSGLSRETVSREMQQIMEQGAVSVEHGGILVKDLALLEKLHGSVI